MKATMIGLDLAKNASQVHGVNAAGEIVLRRRSRKNRSRKNRSRQLFQDRRAGTSGASPK